MTTDAFETAARAEGRVRADEWMEKNGGPQTTGHHIAHTSIIFGFRQGAQWARAQEPTDAEVEAAVLGELAYLQGYDLTDQEDRTEVLAWWNGMGEEVRTSRLDTARAALTAAREATAAAALAEGGEVA